MAPACSVNNCAGRPAASAAVAAVATGQGQMKASPSAPSGSLDASFDICGPCLYRPRNACATAVEFTEAEPGDAGTTKASAHPKLATANTSLPPVASGSNELAVVFEALTGSG